MKESLSIDRVFVYGTLKRGEPNERRLVGMIRKRQNAAVFGFALRDCIRFPGAIPQTGRKVFGELITLKKKLLEVAIAKLDRAEVLYERILVSVVTEHGIEPAWMYVLREKTGVPMRASSWSFSRKLEGIVERSEFDEVMDLSEEDRQQLSFSDVDHDDAWSDLGPDRAPVSGQVYGDEL